jgi:hypothetical protein
MHPVGEDIEIQRLDLLLTDVIRVAFRREIVPSSGQSARARNSGYISTPLNLLVVEPAKGELSWKVNSSMPPPVRLWAVVCHTIGLRFSSTHL